MQQRKATNGAVPADGLLKDGSRPGQPDEVVGQFRRLGNQVETIQAFDDTEIVPFFYFDRFSDFFRWWASWAIPGLGMFCEAYFIFSIGNVKPLLQAEWPNCWNNYIDCNKTLTQSVDYIQIIGIICGMGIMGPVGDIIGRKWGSVSTVSIMLVGAIMLTAVNGKSDRGLVIMYAVSQFVFGFGVGGEYPMAAGSAAERAEAGGPKSAKHRGREVVLTFSMQGVGNFTNTAVLCILMAIFHGTHYQINSKKKLIYNGDDLGRVWRVAFGLGIIPLVFLVFYRTVYLKESAVWSSRPANTHRGQDFRILGTHYWHRLVATAGCWFLWDFSFYGTKVFQSQFIKILAPLADLEVTLLWTLLNSWCALVGYYFSAALIDNPYWGRIRIQLMGFLAVATLFYISAADYPHLITSGAIHAFQFIYFLASFFSQFGPNCTTFLLAGELYPTELRTSAHGISAALGKLGALWASVWFNYLGNRAKFWWSASLNMAGFLLTLLFLPDPMRVQLAEVDRRFRYLHTGKVYRGEAINPSNLSLVERMLGYAKPYDREAGMRDALEDSEMKVYSGEVVKDTEAAHV